MTTTTRQPRGVPIGGQFAATAHTEPVLTLEPAAPVISVPSSPHWSRLIFEDSPSNAERRDYARKALAESLDGDDFEVVHDRDTGAGIRAEADRDDSVDRALDRVAEAEVPHHHLGAAVARELKTIRERRLAVESHYVPTAEATYEDAAAKIGSSPEEYRSALEENFPHVGEEWYEALMQYQRQQPESWQRNQLAALAAVNERNASLKLERPVVGEDENPGFTTHPVTALESRFDALILRGGDPSTAENVRYLANEEGANYGTVFIKEIGRMRLGARRTPGTEEA